MARRSYGTGSLYIHADARGRETWYGRWHAGGRRVKRTLGPKRLPLGRALRAPAAGAAGRSPREPGWLDELLEPLCQSLPLVTAQAAGEPHVMQQAVVVQAE